MPGSVIVACLEPTNDANSVLTDESASPRARFRCVPAGSGDPIPVIVSVDIYCVIDGNDCSNVNGGGGSDPGDGGGSGGSGSTPIITDPEDFAVLSGWVMLIVALGFGIRLLRKAIYSRI